MFFAFHAIYPDERDKSNELSRCDSAIAQTRCSNGDNEERNWLHDGVADDGADDGAHDGVADDGAAAGVSLIITEGAFIFNLGGIILYRKWYTIINKWMSERVNEWMSERISILYETEY